MKFSAEALELRHEYLTAELIERIRSSAPGTDPFTTASVDIPKAFRVGKCEEVSNGRTRIQVLLFWRDDERSEQREIFVDAKNVDGGWLIDDVRMQKPDR